MAKNHLCLYSKIHVFIKYVDNTNCNPVEGVMCFRLISVCIPRSTNTLNIVNKIF